MRMGYPALRLLLTIAACTFIFYSSAAQHRHSEAKPLLLQNIHHRVIDGLNISGGHEICLHLINCSDITVQNCRIGPTVKTGIELYNCNNIVIKNCFIYRVSTGIYVINSRGIQVIGNQVLNVQGPFPRGAMVQFDHVTGSGNLVAHNRVENRLGESYAEDAINMYKSSGTPESPIIIEHNYIRGGGPSPHGGGIMLGDDGGEYQIARYNVLVNPGQYGMAISGGTHLSIVHNKIYSKRLPFSNVGLYIWNQYKVNCAMNTISDNLVNWTNYKGETNHSYNNGNCGAVSGWDSNIFGAHLSENILPQQLITAKSSKPYKSSPQPRRRRALKHAAAHGRRSRPL